MTMTGGSVVCWRCLGSDEIWQASDVNAIIAMTKIQEKYLFIVIFRKTLIVFVICLLALAGRACLQALVSGVLLCLCKLFEQLALISRKVSWDLHLNPRIQVTAFLGVSQVWHSPPAQPERLTGLCAGWDG